jgi:hypothetical protein
MAKTLFTMTTEDVAKVRAERPEVKLLPEVNMNDWSPRQRNQYARNQYKKHQAQKAAQAKGIEFGIWT